MPRYKFHYIIIHLLTIFSIFFFTGGASSDDQLELEKIEREISKIRTKQSIWKKQQADLDKDVLDLRHSLIKIARHTQENEAELTKLEDDLPQLERSYSKQHGNLISKRHQIRGTLSALERLARNPPQALLLSSGEPLKIARSAMLLRGTLPYLQDRVTTLKGDLLRITKLRSELESRREKIKSAEQSLKVKQSRLSALMIHKDAQRKKRLGAKRKLDNRLANLTKRARNIRELIDIIERNRPQEKKRPRQNNVHGQPRLPSVLSEKSLNPGKGIMILPARGTLAKNLGDASKGITIKTRRKAQVVAPFDGQVVFAGPFKGYGQILIIKHRGAYHTLLAGLIRVDVSSEQRLLAGEPIGVMGSRGSGTRLYMEVRRRGSPVNPLPWYAAAKDKVRG